MSEPIRVLHFADIHIGMENYGRTDQEVGLSSRVVDFLRRLDEMIDHARDNDVDLVIFAGDAFKTRAPNPTHQREFAYRMRDLSRLAPTVMLVGNHDIPPQKLKASSIEIYETLGVPNIWVAYEYAGQVVETKRGPVYVATAPYPIRARLLEQQNTHGLTIAEIDGLLQRQLTSIIDELATEADQHDMPRLLTGHFTVSGAVVGSERGIMLGRDVAVGLSSLADDRWDYVALGHVHKHQNLTKGRIDAPPVVYSGSMERIDFGEEGDPKGFCWVELSRPTDDAPEDETTWRFVPVKSRPFVTLRADLRQSINPTQEVLRLIDEHDLGGAVVRLKLQFTPESEARFNDAPVRDALKRAGTFYIAALHRDIDQPARARLGTNPEGLTVEELLDRYFISREIPPDRRTELMDAALTLLNDDEQQETH